MKFCKQLERAVACTPAMQEQPFIRYKQLKKVLKSIYKPAGEAESGSQLQQPQPSGAAEQRFLDMLKEDLAQFNSFFIEREEEAVIRLQDLGDRIKAAAAAAQLSSEQLHPLKTALVDLHGEMVLLLHWSLLNLAAVSKILKKHDKNSALVLKAPVLANVLQQPFNSTAILNDLVKAAEAHIDSVMAAEAQHQQQQQQQPAQQQQQGPGAADATRAADQAAAAPSTPAGAPAGAARHAADGLLQDAAVCARTLMALETWQQLRTNASTPSTVLPADSSDALARALSTRQRWSQVEGLAPIMRQAGGDVQQRQRQQEEQLWLSADEDNTDNADDNDDHPSGQRDPAGGRKHQLSEGLAEPAGGPKRQRPCTGAS